MSDKKYYCGKCNLEALDETVECETCQNWFHFACVEVDSSVDEREWMCEACIAKNQVPPGLTKINTLKPQDSEDDASKFLECGSETATMLAQLEQEQRSKEALLSEVERLRAIEKTRAQETAELQRRTEEQAEELQSLKAMFEKLVANEKTLPAPASSPATIVNDKKEQEVSPRSQHAKESSFSADLKQRMELYRQKALTLAEREKNILNVGKDSSPLHNISIASPSSFLINESPQQCAITEAKALNNLATSMGRVYLRKLPKFDGKEKEWPAFISIYESTTKDGGFSESDNVARLKEALAGEAQSHVLSLLNFSTTATPIIEALREAFGRPDRLIMKLTEDLLAFPGMKSETDVMLRKLAMATMDFVACLYVLKQTCDLKNEFVLQKLLDKLHYSHYKDWEKERLKCADVSKVNLEDFGKFLMARVKEIPPAKFITHDSRDDKKSSSGRVNAHTKDEEPGTSRKCPKCQCSHVLYNCREFRQMKVEERLKYVKDRELCQICLGSTEHAADDCPRNYRCDIDDCGQKHSRFLHVPVEVNHRPLHNESNPSENFGEGPSA
jgi:hypothetical protein